MQLATKGTSDAAEKRIIEENHKQEHSDRATSGTAGEASGRDRLLDGSQVKER
jgi:hypothetical protein